MTALLLEQFKYFRPALAFLARGVFSGLLLGTFTHHLWVKVIPLSGLTATSSDGINGSERVQTGAPRGYPALARTLLALSETCPVISFTFLPSSPFGERDVFLHN